MRGSLLNGNHVITGSSSLPVGLVRATQASFQLLRKRPALTKQLRRNTVFVKDKLLAAGLPVDNSLFPVISLECPAKKAAMALRRRLLANGIYPSCIRYPADTEEVCFRFAFSSEHSREQLMNLVETLSAK